MIQGILSGHIYTDDTDNEKRIEITSFIHNDEWSAFDDIESALLRDIDTGKSDDYWFIAQVEAEFTKCETQDGTEYDVDYTVKEIKELSHLMPSLQKISK